MHAGAARENAPDQDQEVDPRLFGHRASGHGALAAASGIPPQFQANESVYPNPVRISSSEHRLGHSESHETWHEVGVGKTYTPTAEDVGHQLKLECVPVDVITAKPVGPATTVLTSRVIPAPTPTPRRLISLNPVDSMSATDVHKRMPGRETFTLLSYNVLADLYATSEMYSYCPPWALSWTYRKQNLMREIVSYSADIMCLQEVQFLTIIMAGPRFRVHFQPYLLDFSSVEVAVQ